MSRFRYYPTKRLEFIIDSAPYYVDENGKEYHDHQEEIREVLSDRYNKQVERLIITPEKENKILRDKVGEMICNGCKLQLPLGKFYKRSDRGNYRQPCKKCYKGKYGSVPF